MIPHANIIAWQEYAPWIADEQIEQDLVLSRILVEIFSDSFLKQQLAFRGGTALHKLFFEHPLRYSEDIDLVRTTTGPIGKIINRVREVIDHWLGNPTYKRNIGRFTLYYKYKTYTSVPIRIKIEINTRENFSCLGLKKKMYAIDNPWFAGSSEIMTYELEELLATKLRALYQRRKGRDLFDLVVALHSVATIDVDKIIKCFKFYLRKENRKISAKEFISNLNEKLSNRIFVNDIRPLIGRSDFLNSFAAEFYQNYKYDVFAAAEILFEKIINKL